MKIATPIAVPISMPTMVRIDSDAVGRTWNASTRSSLGPVFGARGAHEVLVQRFGDAEADHARVQREKEQRERDPRQDQVRRPVGQPSAQGASASDQRAVARDAEGAQMPERPFQDQPDDHRVSADADQRDERDRAVGPLEPTRLLGNVPNWIASSSTSTEPPMMIDSVMRRSG